MTDSPKTRGDAGHEPPSGTGPSLGRRRWLQAGISAAPVVMTVASRPVLAAVDCRTPSGFVSGFASGAPAGQCGGRTPDFWKGTSTYSGTYQTTDKFVAYFTPDLSPNNQTLQQVLQSTIVTGDAAVARYCVAAMLNNALTGGVPEAILPLATIKGMWTEYKLSTCYSISTSPLVCWYGPEIIEYLQSTMVP